MKIEPTSTYKYRAFGLNVQSDFEIPEFLSAAFSVPDVFIHLGEVPASIDEPEKKGVRYQINEQEFLLHLDQIAWYYVKNGRNITVQKKETSTFQEVRLFLVGHVFAVLLQQRNLFSLHAAALKKGNHGFLICGNSGAGKSTLTREFLNDGYQLLSDDISMLRYIDDDLYVQPSYPFIKLWKDSMEHLDLDEMSGVKLREEIDKYGFALEQEFYAEPLPVGSIFILHAHNKKEYSQELLMGIEKFNVLKNHTYRFQFIADTFKTEHFRLLSDLAEQVPVYRISRPQSPINTQDLKGVLEEHLKEMV